MSNFNNSYDNLPFDETDSYYARDNFPIPTTVAYKNVSETHTERKQEPAVFREHNGLLSSHSELDRSGKPLKLNLVKYKDIRRPHKSHSTTKTRLMMYEIDGPHRRRQAVGIKSLSTEKRNKPRRMRTSTPQNVIMYQIEDPKTSSPTDVDVSMLSNVPAYGIDEDWSCGSRNRSSKNVNRRPNLPYSRGYRIESDPNGAGGEMHRSRDPTGRKLLTEPWNYVHSSAERRRHNLHLFPKNGGFSYFSPGRSETTVDQTYDNIIQAPTVFNGDDRTSITYSMHRSQAILSDSTVMSYRDHTYQNIFPNATYEPTGRSQSRSSTAHHFGVYAAGIPACDRTYASIVEIPTKIVARTAQKEGFTEMHSSQKLFGTPIVGTTDLPNTRHRFESTSTLEVVTPEPTYENIKDTPIVNVSRDRIDFIRRTDKKTLRHTETTVTPNRRLENKNNTTPTRRGAIKLTLNIPQFKQGSRAVLSAPNDLPVQFTASPTSITAEINLDDLLRKIEEIAQRPLSSSPIASIRLVPNDFQLQP